MPTVRLLIAISLIGIAAAAAQDVAGVEDCTKTSGLDRRTGCLQSNINFLQRTITRNALEAHRRLQAAEAEVAALKLTLADLRKHVEALEAARRAEHKQAEEQKMEGKKK